MTYFQQADEVRLQQCELSNFRGTTTLNILPQLQSLSIYESLDQPTLICDLVIEDNINLATTFPLIGEESLRFVFQTTNQPYSTPVEMKFKIFELSGMHQGGVQNRGQTYTIRGVSEEHIIAVATTLENSYNSKTTDQCIEDILKTHIGTKKQVFTDPCKSTQTICLPSLNSLQAIDFFRRRAVSVKYPTSSFVFFENKDGFQFKTVEQLVSEGLKQTKEKLVYVHTPMGVSSPENARALGLFNIINYCEIARQDQIDKIQLGTFDCVVSTYDFITKKYEMVDFDWENTEQKVVKTSTKAHSGSNQLKQQLQQISGKKGNRKKAINYFLPKDISKGEHFIETSLGARQAYATLMLQAQLIILVPGNTRLTCGDVIQVDIRTTQRDKSNLAKYSQTSLSGDYLVSKLRHVIMPGPLMSHRMSLELIRLGHMVI